MKRTVLISMVLFLLMTSANARTWTNRQGKKVDAEVVKVNKNRTVVLKNGRGKTFSVTFDSLVEEDVTYLEYLLSRVGRSKLHSVPWDELNELFGLQIWKDDFLWDDPTAEAAERMELDKESKTDFMENHRAYPLGEENILNEPAYTTVLYGGRDNVASLSFVFLNQGDVPSHSANDAEELIEASGMRIHDTIAPVLGKPKRDTLGKGDLREKVWRWDWNDHAIMLSLQEGKYAALRIMPSKRADRAGRTGKITEAQLKARMASCVERRESGDVVVVNIPMIDQGPKGYCSPATWERYLRYMDIPADMYLLALAANTSAGGGTYSYEMIEATKNYISANGRELEDVVEELSPEGIAEYIDMGLPIMWRLMSTPSFQFEANVNTIRRRGEEADIESSGQAEDTTPGGHICLIVGYNRETDEIAISDSWGPKFAERWVSAHDARRVSTGSMNIIKW